MSRPSRLAQYSVLRHRAGRRRFRRPAFEHLESRCLLAFSVVADDVFSGPNLKLRLDFNQPVNVATVQASDVQVGGLPAASFAAVDADTYEFVLPTLNAGSHTITIAAGAILDMQGTSLDAFARQLTVASASQFVMKYNPRLQPGNAPLGRVLLPDGTTMGYAGSELDQVDILWETMPGSGGTQDSFAVHYRPAGSSDAWQPATLNSTINTGVQGRVIHSASILGLDWHSGYEYRVRHFQGGVIVGQYQHEFRTRLAPGDPAPFTFVAYGDSAYTANLVDSQGRPTGFRLVQQAISDKNPAFAVLLGDNVYNSGTHQELDARFDPLLNPEAAAWMASHIDYLGLGNHDNLTGNGLPSQQLYSVPIPVAGVNAPVAPPAIEAPEHSFSFDYGDVHFVTFDTDKWFTTGSSRNARLDALLDYVIADLAASPARWKIVYGHHPVGGTPDKSESPSDYYYQQVVSRFVAAGVDLFMTGHSHTYAWTYPLTGQVNGVATFVNRGEYDLFHADDGLPQLVSGVGGKDLRGGTFSQFPFVAAGFSQSTPVLSEYGFSLIDVTQDELTIKYVSAVDGRTIDEFTITKAAAPLTDTLEFQQRLDGYAATFDTYLQQSVPNANNATATSLVVDSADTNSGAVQALLRLENLFGTGSGQIPLDAEIRSARLELRVTDAGDSLNLHRMLVGWQDTASWNSLVGGLNAGVEYLSSVDASSGTISAVGTVSINVLTSLQAWQAGTTPNHGWAIIPTNSNGVQFNSAEGATPPKLIVTYLVDGNVPPIARDDSVVVDRNTATNIAVLTNDRDGNGDTLVVQSVTTPAHGTVVVNPDQKTVRYTPAANYLGSDSFSYTISDGNGGTATATVTIDVVLPTTTLVLQQRLNGYSGTVDTLVHQNAPNQNNAAATTLKVDGEDPAPFKSQALVRFDGLFDGGAWSIPADATIQSATLQLNVTDAGTRLDFHRMLRTWSDTDTWNTLVGGITIGTEAASAADATSGGNIPTGTLTLNVLPSLLAWQASPESNYGWVVNPASFDGVIFHSAEGTTPPKLTVVYVLPPSNSLPLAEDDEAETDEELAVTIAVLVNDSDHDGDTLSVTAAGPAANGAVVVNPDNTVTYAPAAGFFGSDTFSYTISDGQGGTASASVRVTVHEINKPPVSITLTSSPVPENEPGAIIGTLSASDPNAGDTHTFSTTDPRFEILGNQLRLKADQALDFEAGASVLVSVTATDTGSPPRSLTQAVVVNVANVNEAPSDIQLSRSKVFADIAGAWISQVTTRDPDAGDSHTYAVSDSRFTVRDGHLFLVPDAAIDLATEDSITVEITATDAGTPGLSVMRAFELTVEPAPADWQFAFQWKPRPYDVNGDHVVSPLDALLIIIELNSSGVRDLPTLPPGTAPPLFLDVSGDGQLTTLDALLVIIQLNAGGGGEAEALSRSTPDAAPVPNPLWLESSQPAVVSDADELLSTGFDTWESLERPTVGPLLPSWLAAEETAFYDGDGSSDSADELAELLWQDPAF